MKADNPVDYARVAKHMHSYTDATSQAQTHPLTQELQQIPA